MAYIEHEFNGVTRRLSFTAEALFRIYDKFGYSSDLLELTKINANTAEGWDNLCWIYALLAAQGELQRRAMHEDPLPMLKYEELKRMAMPPDALRMRQAVCEAMDQGFKRTAAPTDQEEVDLVLAELEENEKKKAAGGVTGFFSSLLQAFCSE